MKISLVTLARGAVLLWLLLWATTSFAQADSAPVEVLERLSAPDSQLNAWRRGIALGLVGSGASAGYQWAGGGPRARYR
jgi:hypothetical protein